MLVCGAVDTNAGALAGPPPSTWPGGLRRDPRVGPFTVIDPCHRDRSSALHVRGQVGSRDRVSDTKSFGFRPGGLPPGTPPGRVIVDIETTGFIGYLNERDRWRAEMARRRRERGDVGEFLLSLGDAEYEAEIARRERT
jgi:hypothetical protein